jgi:predicted Fe-Mo cluster-binding NifX family protein
MPNTVIAVPCEAPGGLDAAISPFFGHAPAFTLVTVDGNRVLQTAVLAVASEGEHPGLAIVGRLKDAGADAAAVADIGRKPLMACADLEILVFDASPCSTVGEAVLSALAGRLALFDATRAQDCGSNGCGCHGDDHDHGHDHGHA